MAAEGRPLSHGRWTTAAEPWVSPRQLYRMAAGSQPSHNHWKDGRQRASAAANPVDKACTKAFAVVPKNPHWPEFSSLEKPDRVPLGAEGAEMAEVHELSEATARRTAVAMRAVTSAVATASGSPPGQTNK